MGKDRSDEISTTDLRQKLAEVLNEAAVRGKTTYVTGHGRRIAAIVPVPVAEAADEGSHDDSPRSSA